MARSSAKASSSPPPPNTTPPYTTHHHHPSTSPPRLTYLRPITIHHFLHHRPRLSLTRHHLRPAASHPPPTPAFNTRLQHPPTTRRRTRSLHIIHHGSVIENACCCPRNGWRRRCSSAGKSLFSILCRDTTVLACPCMRTYNPSSGYRKSYRPVYLEFASALLVLRPTGRRAAVASSRLCSCWLASMVLSQQRQRKLVLAICISIHGASKTTYATSHNLKHAETTKGATSIPGRGGQLQRSDNVLRR